MTEHKTVGVSKAALDHADSEKASLSKTIEEVFIRFSSALKTAQIYAPNNLTFVNQNNLLFSLIQNIITSEGEALFQFRENTLFFNSVRVKFDFSSYHRFKFLSEGFRKKGIEKINFEPGLTESELIEFVILFGSADGGEGSSFEDFQEKMRAKGIRNINLEKIHPYEMSASSGSGEIKSAACKVFFKGITHLKEVFEREDQNKRIKIKTTRRLMQSMINLVGECESFMLGLTNLKNYDEYTLNHSINVSILALCLGRRLGLEKRELLDLGIGAFFHDIGKIEVPEEVLNKKGKLDENEWKIMTQHPHFGAEKLASLKELNYLPVGALYIALEHHNWVDLSGYPRYWKKDNINFYSRIVKICDVFDAVTTKRVYRDNAMSRHKALSIMLEKSGSEFDALLLKVFANMIGVYPIGTLVALDSDELGVVVETNPEVAFMLRPKVKLITDKEKNRIDGEIIDLTGKDPETEKYKRTVVKILDPDEYDINIADYFIAQGQ
jgi:putative nucleotidyltransferase with HDIG domain